MNRTLKIGILCVCLMFSLLVFTGCSLNKSINEKNSENSNIQSKGNYDVFGCMEKLNSENTVEEMNEIIGFDGELTDEQKTYKVYKWKLTDDTSITAQFSTSSNTATISANYPNKLITKKADFSKWDEIKEKLNSKDLTYDEFVKLVGGVEGTLERKTSSSITYQWINADGNYLLGYFDAKTGTCTMATGKF